jgi:hypothetical protein
MGRVPGAREPAPYSWLSTPTPPGCGQVGCRSAWPCAGTSFTSVNDGLGGRPTGARPFCALRPLRSLRPSVKQVCPSIALPLDQTYITRRRGNELGVSHVLTLASGEAGPESCCVGLTLPRLWAHPDARSCSSFLRKRPRRTSRCDVSSFASPTEFASRRDQ